MNALIMKGVVIDKESVVVAGAVVTESIPDKVIADRKTELRLLKL